MSTPDHSPAPRTAAAVWLRRAAAAMGVLIAGTVAVTAATALYLDSTAGHRRLAGWLEDALSDETTTVRLDTISGTLFGDTVLAGLSIADRDGVWLSVPRARIVWRPGALLARRLQVSRLAVPDVHMLRRPIPSAETEDSSTGIPRLPVSLDVAGLTVDRLRLDAPVLGRRHMLAAEGRRIAVTDAALSIDLTVRGDGDTLAAVADWRPDAAFMARVTAEGASGGVLSSLIGAGRLPVSLAVEGDGAPADWSATITGRLGEDASTRARLSWDGQVARLAGTATPGAVPPPAIRALLGADVGFELTATRQPDGMLVDARAETAAVDARAGGLVDPDQMTLSGPVDFALTSRDLSAAADLLAPVGLRDFDVAGWLSGPLARPTVAVAFRIGGLRHPAGRVASTVGRIQANVDTDAIAVAARGQLAGVVPSGGQAGTPPFDQPVRWRTTASIDSETGRLSVDALSIELSDIQLAAAGRVGLDDDQIDMDATLRVDDLRALADIAGLPVTGRMTLSVEVDQTGRAAPLTVLAGGTVAEPGVGEAAIDRLLGPRLWLAGQADIGAAGAVTLSSFEVQGRQVALRARGTLDAGRIDLDYRLGLDRLDRLPGAGGLALAGGIDLSGRLTGPAADPTLTTTARLASLELQGTRLRDLDLQATAATIASAPEGTIALTAGSDLGPVNGQVRFATLDDGTLDVPELVLTTDAFRLDGGLTKPAGRPVRGRIAARTLAAIPTVDDADTALGLSGTLTADLELSDRDGAQAIGFAVTARQIATVLPGGQDLAVAAADSQGELILADTGPRLTLDARGNDVTLDDVTLRDLAVAVRNDAGATDYQLGVRGRIGAPFDLSAQGRVTAPPGGPMSVTTDLNGEVAGRVVGLDAPIRLERTAGGLTVAPFTLRVADATVTAQGTLTGDRLATSARLSELDLATIRAFAPAWPLLGRVTGSATVAGRGRAVDATVALTATDVLLAGHGAEQAGPGRMTLDGRLTDGRLDVRAAARLTGVTDTQLTASLPLDIDVAARTAAVPRDRPIEAEASWTGRIDPLWPLVDAPDHEFVGDITAAVSLTGTADDPTLAGTLSVTDGRYDNADTGFVASDLTVEASFDGEQLVLGRLGATDGDGGRLSATGRLDVVPGGGFPGYLDLTLDRATVLRRSDATAVTSADLRLNNDADGLSLTGSVDVARVDAELVDLTPSGVVDLEVIEINGPDAMQGHAAGAVGPRRPVALSLDVRAPQRLRVYGRGLDAEWQGALAISGTIDQPAIAGTLSLDRGRFDFAGKRFVLTEGSLQFDGSTRIDPYLDVRAEYQARDLTAFIRVEGRSTDPTITLTSQPALPEDEVLARVLFGTSVTELSALETVQLASAVASLSGGGGPDALGIARRTLRLDRLTLNAGNGDDEGTTVTGGKYLTNNIYVEVSTATATGETSAQMEVDLTRNLSLVSRLGQDRDNNLSIRWSWDY